MILVRERHWDRSEEVAVRVEDNYTVPKCSICRFVRFAEAGEVEPDTCQIAEVAVVGAAQNTVKGRSSNAEARKDWRTAAAGVVVGDSEDSAGTLNPAGPAENRLLAN